MSYGLLQKFEDFYPYSDTEALCVHGNSYVELSNLSKLHYDIKDKVIIYHPIENIKTGKHLRLGNYYGGHLYHSDVYSVFKDDDFICEGIQPYGFDLGVVYQYYGFIKLNDEIIISPPNNYKVCGRPTVYQDHIYYETRKDDAPMGWEVWRYDLHTNINEFVIKGANPYVYKDVLFYSLWNGKEFDLCTYKIR